MQFWLGHYNSLKIKVAAPPERGKANQAVIGLLAERLELPITSFSIAHGETSPRKVIEIKGITREALEQALII